MVLEFNALYRLWAAQGVLGLRKKCGDLRLEAAYRQSLSAVCPTAP
jgi:hypothetical protein